MIICLSGFVIAGASPTCIPATARTDISMSMGVSVGGSGAGAGGARYSPHHHQLLAHFASPLIAGRSSSSSAESVSSASASPPPAPPLGASVGSNMGIGLGTGGRVRTLYACLGESEGELSFEPNQIITNVTASPEPGWLRGTLNGKTGLVPENYVERLP
ncbi:hypothetical protein evm_010364 [Chilo suppressalis]|nr:hypothetical protein evm_010364 [Chilo suppressalis]